MPYGEPDEEDPMELMAMEIPATRDSVEDMVSCFAEEYARMGYSAARIMELFKNPHYVPAYGALQQVGEKKVRQMVAEALFIYGHREGA